MKRTPHFGVLTFALSGLLVFLHVVSAEISKAYIVEDDFVPLLSRVHVPGSEAGEAPAVRVIRAGYDYRLKKRWAGDGIAYLHKSVKDEPVGPFPYDVQVVLLDGNGAIVEVGEVGVGQVYRPSHAYSGFIALRTNRLPRQPEKTVVYELRSGACYALTARPSRSRVRWGEPGIGLEVRR